MVIILYFNQVCLSISLESQFSDHNDEIGFISGNSRVLAVNKKEHMEQPITLMAANKDLRWFCFQNEAELAG
jgi:hypothetical protein